MTAVIIKNNTSNNIAFEARIMTLQGQHVTVRASLPGGKETSVPLPNGVTPAMLATAPEVIAEQAKSSPNWSIVSVSASETTAGLSDYDVFRAIDAPASKLYTLGCAQRSMKLVKLRLCGVTATGAGESLKITELRVNGVNVLPVAQQLTLPASTAAYTDVSIVLSGSWTAIKEGDMLEVLTAYVAGAATLTAASIEVVGSKA